MRLSKALGVDFPFAAYAAIEHIPVIEVEFVHLAGLENYPGQLAILDTPGPNEAGQPHLQKMLNEQLARASAVLAVMDYTQLKSISDEEVRQAIAAVGKSVPLYALVNKFDQKRPATATMKNRFARCISGTLMNGSITPGQIFPGLFHVGVSGEPRASRTAGGTGGCRIIRNSAGCRILPRPRSAGAGGAPISMISNIFVMPPICCGKIRYLNSPYSD